MKRCPHCNRLETDDALGFCRTDGTPLVIESANIGFDVGTIRLDSGPVIGETETRLLEQSTATTGEIATKQAGPTVVLVAPKTTAPQTLPKFRKRLFVIVGAALILAIVFGAGIAYYMSRKASSVISSIAVMPFVNLSGNSNLDYLSDGMTETLISNLSQLPNLSVKARSSVFRYKGKETSAETVGRELNVQAVLNGRVSQQGNQLTLTLELVDARTENVIWSEQYNRQVSEIVNLQSDIARDVSSKLKTKLSGADAQKLAKTYTSNPEAYRLYLQGRFFWGKREEKDLRSAIDYFNRAIALDTNYALAYAGIADSYVLMAGLNFMTPEEAIPQARGYARRALTLDPSLAEPHTTLGLTMLQFDYDFASAEREYKRALELNPNYATAHQWYGELLSCVGRFDEASAELQRALELEPLSLPINWDYGRFLYNARRFDEALVQHKKTIDLDSGFIRVRKTLAEVYRIRKDYASAIQELAKYSELRGQP